MKNLMQRMNDSMEGNHQPSRKPQVGASAQLAVVSPSDPSAQISIRSSATVFALDEPTLIEATLVQAVLGRWKWLLAGGVALGILAFAFGLRAVDSSKSAWIQLIRNDQPASGDPSKLRVLPTGTLADMLRNPSFLQRVGSQANPPLSSEELARSVKARPERDGDILTVTVSGMPTDSAVEVANVFARTAVEFTRELQAQDAADEQNRLKQHLERIESDLAKLNEELRSLPPAPLSLAERYKSLSNNLDTARAELVNFKPLFSINEEGRRIKLIEKVTALEKQQHVVSQINEMEDSRVVVGARLRAAESLGKNLPGYYRLLGPATHGDGRVDDSRVKVVAFTIFGAVFGVLATAGLILLVELFDDRLKTSPDVSRISQLPLLATLGDLRPLNSSEQAAWSLRAWSSLQHQLNALPNGALVCGIISSRAGEGRSTWVNLLAHAASQCGLRVLSLVIDSSPRDSEKKGRNGDNDKDVMPVTVSPLASSYEITERLIGADAQTLVQISLPRWSWTLNRRQQWQTALEHWSQIEDLVILIELPPASVSESLLLAETLPNVIWLVDAGKTTATELREHLKVFRQARCNLIGTGLNHELPSPRQSRFFQAAPAMTA